MKKAFIAFLFLILVVFPCNAATIVGSAAGGNFHATTTWVGGVVPTKYDDVQLTSSSGNLVIDASNCSVKSLDTTGWTGTLSGGSYNILTAYGTVKFTFTMGTPSFNGTLYVAASGDIYSGGKNLSFSTTITSGTINLRDNWNATTYPTTFTVGGGGGACATGIGNVVFNTNNFSITADQFLVQSPSRYGTVYTNTVNLGSSSISCGVFYVTGSQVNTIINAGTSTITIGSAARSFYQFGSETCGDAWYTAGYGYYNVIFTGTSANPIYYYGESVIHDFTISSPPKNIIMDTAAYHNTGITITNFTASGSAGNLITITGAPSPAPKTTFNYNGGGKVSCDYMSISNVLGAPTRTWYMGVNSVNGGGNTGIYFTIPPAPATLNLFNIDG